MRLDFSSFLCYYDDVFQAILKHGDAEFRWEDSHHINCDPVIALSRRYQRPEQNLSADAQNGILAQASKIAEGVVAKLTPARVLAYA